MLRNCSASGRIESVRGASSSGRARGSQSRGERFKSAALHQISNQKPAGEEAERDFCFFCCCERVIYICSAPCAPALVDSSTSILVLSNKIRCDFSISIFTCKFSCYVIDSFTTEMLSRYGYTYQRLGRLSGK